jgi:hypothetical protein
MCCNGLPELLVDADGALFINYMAGMCKDILAEQANLLIEFFEQQREKENDISVKQKYGWQISYLSKCIKLYKVAKLQEK